MPTQIAQSMISEVSICNQAMSFVGAKPISSLDEPSAQAEWCRNNYAFLRDAVLEERMWTFATARARSETADLDAWKKNYLHRLPEEWLLVYRVYEDDEGLRRADWAREGEFVVTPSPVIYFWGLHRVVDTNKFTQMFVQTLVARMAADAAIPLTENRQLQADLWGIYRQKLEEAAARDGQQGRNEIIAPAKTKPGLLTGSRRR